MSACVRTHMMCDVTARTGVWSMVQLVSKQPTSCRLVIRVKTHAWMVPHTQLLGEQTGCYQEQGEQAGQVRSGEGGGLRAARTLHSSGTVCPAYARSSHRSAPATAMRACAADQARQD
jgi:hypothetical protein